jgi:hypothetical protein
MVRFARSFQLLVLALVVLAFAGCAKSIRVKTAKNPSAQFGSFATFAIGKEDAAPKTYASTPMAEDIRVRVESLVARELTAKGYAAKNEAPDLLVRVGSGVRVVKDTKAAHGTPDGVGGGNELDVEHDETQGSVRVDVWDTKTNTLVFRGVASTIAAAKEEDPARLSDAIRRMFEDFPAR